MIILKELLEKRGLKFYFLICMGLLQSCEKDKNVDDFKREKFLKDFSQMKVIEGEFRGYLNRKNSVESDQIESLGALSIKLAVTSKVIESADGSKPIEQPILSTTLTVLNGSKLEISAAKSSFDSESNVFVAEIQIARPFPGPSASATISRSDSSNTIVLRGSLQGNRLVGSLEVIGFDRDLYGGDFDLSKEVSTSLEKLNKLKKPTSGFLFSQLSYEGQTQFANGKNKKVLVSVFKPTTTGEEDFLSILIPLVPVQISFNYGNAAIFAFDASAYLDLRNGILTGQMASRADSNNKISSILHTVTCRFENIESNFKNLINENLDCEHVTFRSAGAPVASTKLRPNKGRVREPPADSAADRKSQTKNYNGVAHINSDNSYQERAFVLLVSKLFASRIDEITELFYPTPEDKLRVALVSNDNTVSINFGDSVSWDKTSQTLDGYTTRNVSSEPVTVQIQCQNFDFDRKNYSFNCNYSTTLKVESIVIEFRKR